jgi:hypothetical protein
MKYIIMYRLEKVELTLLVGTTTVLSRAKSVLCGVCFVLCVLLCGVCCAVFCCVFMCVLCCACVDNTSGRNSYKFSRIYSKV